MVLSSLRHLPHGSARRLLQAERRLAERYADLVRLAYLVLPASLGRHRRVLLAHSLVQRSLPEAVPTVPAPRSPGATGRGGGGRGTGVGADPSRSVWVPVLRGALGLCRRPRLWPPGARPPRLLLPRLPVVLGLRLFPRVGGAEEIVLGQALSGLSAPARAAFVLLRVECLTEDETRAVLTAADAPDAEAAVREAARLDAALGATAAALPASDEFDACTLQARPTDLVRRRRRVRLAGAALVVALTASVSAVAGSTHSAPDAAGPDRADRHGPRAADLVRVDPRIWADTSRVDFTAWPARGDRTGDRALLDRALAVWARPSSRTQVTHGPGTTTEPPSRAPQLLYAGVLDGRSWVVFHDGQRLARYSESDSGDTLSVARVDDADVTTAAAVALDTRDGTARYLLAPWVAETATRDLARPDSPARPLAVSRDGVTVPVPLFDGGGEGAGGAASGGCGRHPVLQFRSSSAIAEHHAFLLAGLGGLTPVHLTYTPLPGHGSPPARQPREATGPAALTAWARVGCGLGGLAEGGVKAVNAWDFAEQDLPDGGGHAVWTCSRADTWEGTGDVTVALRLSGARPGEPARTVTRARSTAACSRFGQNVLARTRWRSPQGRWYVLAAGSRAVTGLTLTGDVDATRRGRTLAVRAPEHAATRVRARLVSGEELGEVSGRRR
ncbi:hypothetical protein [Streptomyces sp. NPDC005573]|uniref:hypothetical protein n=1 Tax=Streptomyces sp. NPDC005573 TaxID=3156890 RepID=UPI0033B1AC55